MKNFIFLLFIAFAQVATGQSQDFGNKYFYLNEYISQVNADVIGTDPVASNSGTGANSGTCTGSSKKNAVSCLVSTTGTTTTGRAQILSQVSAITFGGGEWTFRLKVDSFPVLSSVGQRFQYMVGFLDASTANQTDGVYFLYDEGGVSTGSTASANWQCVTVNNSTRTFTTGTTAVAVTGADLKIIINQDGTEAVFYVDDVEQARHSTNIPVTPFTRTCGFGWVLLKSAGSTAALVHTDFMMVECVYTTPK